MFSGFVKRGGKLLKTFIAEYITIYEWRKNKFLVCVTDLSCIFAAHLQFKFV